MATIEKIFFQQDGVTVTTARAVMGNTTYSLANVTSVGYFLEPRPAAVFTSAMCLAVGGLGLAMAGVMALGLLLLALGLGLAGIYFLHMKPKHWVSLGTSGAEKHAVWSHSLHWTQAVIAAVNEAIVARP